MTLFICNSAISQSYRKNYDSLTQNFSGKELLTKVDSLLAHYKATDSTGYFIEFCHRFGLYHVRKKDFEKALKYGQMATAELEKSSTTIKDYTWIPNQNKLKNTSFIDSLFVRSAYNVGRFYRDMGNYEASIGVFERIIENDAVPLRTAQAHIEIGNCRNKLGDYFNASSFYEKGLSLLKNVYQQELANGNEAAALFALQTFASQNVNLALPYFNIGTPESMAKRQKVLDRADSLRQIIKLKPGVELSLIIALGNQYTYEGYFDFEKAYHYFTEGLKISMQYRESYINGLLLNNIANIYNIKKSDSALYYVEQGFKYGTDQENTARLYDTKSHYHTNRGEWFQALKDIHKALETNIGQSLEIEKAPGLLALSKTEFKDHAIYCLKEKATILIKLFEQTGDENFLFQTINHVKATDAFIDLIQDGSYENATKLLWRKTASEIYIKGVYASHLLGHSDELFYFIEKNRALLLSQEIAVNTAFTNLPNTVVTKIHDVKKNVLQLENQAAENTGPAYRDSLFTAKRNFQGLMDSVKQAYPAYFARNLNLTPVTLAEWQQSLQTDTTFVSYIWNKLNDDSEILIGLAVNHNTSQSFKIDVDDSLRSLIRQYLSLVSKPANTQQNQRKTRELSHMLFQKLLPTPAIQAMAQQKNLLLVPDGPLQFIPFEALITNTESNQFLIESTDVSYLYSVSFLNHNNQIRRSASKRLTAYAPVNFNKTELKTLEKTRAELNAIESQIGGNMVLEDQASKTRFLNKSGDYRMIHLATHADAGGVPWIAFSDEKLQLHELYTYKNNADLVALSACNTQLGEMVSGEGVLSLSRGFFYAGAKSVMASLWNVDDQSTSGIMADFYANLDAGLKKSEALAEAKRNYLKTHSLSELSPYYWSSIVLVGDGGTVNMSVSHFHLYLTVGLFLVLLILVFLRKRLS